MGDYKRSQERIRTQSCEVKSLIEQILDTYSILTHYVRSFNMPDLIDLSDTVAMTSDFDLAHEILLRRAKVIKKELQKPFEIGIDHY